MDLVRILALAEHGEAELLPSLLASCPILAPYRLLIHPHRYRPQSLQAMVWWRDSRVLEAISRRRP